MANMTLTVPCTCPRQYTHASGRTATPTAMAATATTGNGITPNPAAPMLATPVRIPASAADTAAKADTDTGTGTGVIDSPPRSTRRSRIGGPVLRAAIRKPGNTPRPTARRSPSLTA